MRPYYYILVDGKAVPAHSNEWGSWFKTADRTVTRTKIGDVTVSTVFLSMDHNFTGDGDPVLFETLVFDGPYDGEMERYSTIEDARAGHERMVMLVKGDNHAQETH